MNPEEHERLIQARFPIPETAKERMPRTRAAYRWLLYGPEPLEERTIERASEKYGVNDPTKLRQAADEDGVLAKQLELAGFVSPLVAVQQTTPLPSLGSIDEARKEIAERQSDIERLRHARQLTRLELDNADSLSSRKLAVQLLRCLDGMLAEVTGLSILQAATRSQVTQATKSQAPEPPSRPASGRIVTIE